MCLDQQRLHLLQLVGHLHAIENVRYSIIKKTYLCTNTADLGGGGHIARFFGRLALLLELLQGMQNVLNSNSVLFQAVFKVDISLGPRLTIVYEKVKTRL